MQLAKEMYNTEKIAQWYIFYTSPRCENIVREQLEKMDYEVFLPSVNVLRTWKNRQKKMISKVLFPGYIFVYTIVYEIDKILRLSKVHYCIKTEAKPAVLSSHEIEAIRKMLNIDGLAVHCDFQTNNRVRIIQGPLSGYEGVLSNQLGKNRFGIHLQGINQTISVEISTSDLEIII